jgi:hypothetical protein
MEHVALVDLTATESDGIVVIPDLKYPAANVVGVLAEKILDIIAINGFASIKSNESLIGAVRLKSPNLTVPKGGAQSRSGI